MAVDLRGVQTIVLPGTGSDADYAQRAFSAALSDAGAEITTPRPDPAGLIAGYWSDLTAAADGRPVAVGGVSIGAAVSVAWALAHPDTTIAVLAALPAWTGLPDTAPAALAARRSASILRCDGLESAIEQMRASSPKWLADELARSWRAQWPDLPDAMEEAARYVAPTPADLAELTTPMGVVAAVDDPVHPIAVARQWVQTAPRAALRTTTLDQLGADPAVLGAGCLSALDSL